MPTSPNKKYVTALVIELAVIIWGFASASGANYGTTIWLSAAILLFFIPATLFAWYASNRDYEKQIASGVPMLGAPKQLRWNWKVVGFIVSFIIISLIYGAIFNSHTGKCTSLESFPDSVTCHFKK